MILINITVQSPHVTVITWYKVLQDEIRRIAVIIDFGNRIRQFSLSATGNSNGAVMVALLSYIDLVTILVAGYGK